MYQQQQQQQGGPGSFNRSTSWAPDRSTLTPSSGWSTAGNSVTNWLSLKNLTPQIDGSTLKTLCMQHGPVQSFYMNLQQGQAMVRYSSKEEALKAQKSLNHCVLGNTTIMADFIPDNELPGLVEQSQLTGSQGSLSSWSSGATSKPAPPMRSVSSFPAMSSMGGGGSGKDSWNVGGGGGGNSMWSSGSSSGGSSSLWGPLDEHNPGLLPGDLLGGQ